MGGGDVEEQTAQTLRSLAELLESDLVKIRAQGKERKRSQLVGMR